MIRDIMYTMLGQRMMAAMRQMRTTVVVSSLNLCWVHKQYLVLLTIPSWVYEKISYNNSMRSCVHEKDNSAVYFRELGKVCVRRQDLQVLEALTRVSKRFCFENRCIFLLLSRFTCQITDISIPKELFLYFNVRWAKGSNLWLLTLSYGAFYWDDQRAIRSPSSITNFEPGERCCNG
jgi:hypothetical protein